MSTGIQVTAILIAFSESSSNAIEVDSATLPLGTPQNVWRANRATTVKRPLSPLVRGALKKC